jgi:hypothetical protein
MKRIWWAAVAVAVWTAAAGTAMAQVERASLTGTARDASDAILPGVTVKVRNVDTNVASEAVTDSTGTYRVLSLLPGQYEIEATLTGFQSGRRLVELQVGQRARVDLTLSLGGVTEQVDVQAETPMLNTETAMVGTVVNQMEVSRLPLAIRNWDDLLALVPGVQSDRYTEQAGGTAAGRTGGVSVRGNRSLQNNFLLDGVANNSFSTNVQELSTQISRPSVDAIGEFKVVTSPFTAEYGWAPGAAVIVSTKSGTNNLRGTAYHFLRNDRFDSNNFFARRANQPKPTNNQNQFGGNVGGPISRNRAFFFADVEGTRIEQGVLRTGRILNLNERQGIFASAVRDPLTNQPFLNNTIPADRIDPVAARLIAMLPEPNASGSNNYINQPNVEDRAERYLGRVDVRLGQSDSMFGRYIYTDRFRYVPGFLGGIVDGTSTSAWGRNYLSSHGVVAGWNKVIGSTLVNEARFSYARGVNDGTQDPFGEDGNAAIGFRGVPNDPRVVGGIVGMDISGHIRLGSPNFMPKFQHTDQFQYLNTVTWQRGQHQLKFGADVMMPVRNEYFDVAPTRGNLTFNGQFSGNAMADFLLGYAQRAQLTNVLVVDQRLWSTSFFVQDDWKATSRLTATLGLRYDFMTPPYESDNRMANFDPDSRGLVFAQSGSLEQRSLVKPDTNNFAPRLGLVYQLNERSVLRGGYGIFYNQFERIGSEDQLALNPPGLLNIDVQAAGGSLVPVLLMRNGFAEGFLDPARVDLARIMTRAADRDSSRTIVHQFGAGIERQLGPDFVVSADLVGSVTRNLAVLRNLNQPLPGTRDANGPVPYPGFGHIQWREMTGRGRYAGLDLSFEKRFSQGYSYRASYTLGRARDNASEHLSPDNDRPQNGRDLEAWYADSNFDIRHRLVGNFIAELPFGQGKPFAQEGIARHALGGWLVSGIFSTRTGRPFTVRQATNNTGAGTTGLPNLVGNPEGPKTVEQWFNTAAFELVPSGTFGNAGRNILRGPGWVTFDMSLQRRIDITQKLNATLRWDVFNLFDRANLGNPERNISAATAGVISTLAGDPRVMQFSVRVAF